MVGIAEDAEGGSGRVKGNKMSEVLALKGMGDSL